MRERPRSKKVKKESVLKETLYYHLQNNAKEYFFIFIVFAIGIVLGVIFINKMGEKQKEETTLYLQEFVTNIKKEEKIDTFVLLKESVQKNVILGLLLWFIGSTIIGVPFICLTIAFRGFCLGYTISAVLAVFKMPKGLLFFFASLFLQNLLFIPCIIAIAVSGLKFYHYVMKEKEKGNIKQEIRRHTMFSFLCIILLILTSIIECCVSTNLLVVVAKYL